MHPDLISARWQSLPQQLEFEFGGHLKPVTVKPVSRIFRIFHVFRVFCSVKSPLTLVFLG